MPRWRQWGDWENDPKLHQRDWRLEVWHWSFYFERLLIHHFEFLCTEPLCFHILERNCWKARRWTRTWGRICPEHPLVPLSMEAQEPFRPLSLGLTLHRRLLTSSSWLRKTWRNWRGERRRKRRGKKNARLVNSLWGGLWREGCHGIALLSSCHVKLLVRFVLWVCIHTVSCNYTGERFSNNCN